MGSCERMLLREKDWGGGKVTIGASVGVGRNEIGVGVGMGAEGVKN